MRQFNSYEIGCRIGGGNMLKGISKILSPELLKVLCEMGHSDRLVISKTYDSV